MLTCLSRITDLGNPQMNADGIQNDMTINYLGPYIFTNSLLPLLESTALLDGTDVRIINVGSGGYRYAKNLEYYSKGASSQTVSHSNTIPTEYLKLALHLRTNNLARRLSKKHSKILVIITQPSSILGDGTIRPLYPQTTGTYTSIFAACAPRDNPEIFQSAYVYAPNIAVPQEPIAFALDEDKQRKLVEFTEKFLQSIGV
ncbi:hypothetical protein IW262DRAFT_1279177 [Armillaria fumosa]|nr:hypothetical protein IW262DRAFT_1279177 [Armillaria fumosa]